MKENDFPRFSPIADGINLEFYKECEKSGKLNFQKCLDCGTWRHLPRYRCPQCGSDRWEWSPSSGKGKLYSWTVTHKPAIPVFQAVVPYIIAVVELEEGVRMVATLRETSADRLKLDMPVSLRLQEFGAGPPLPYFVPAI